MDRVVTFVYHHMGCLKRDRDGNVRYKGDLVTEIHKVNVETCNLFFVEGLFLDLEPGFDLGKGLRVLRTDAEVMRMCESTIKNDNTVHVYFDHPIDANPEIIDDDVVSDSSSESVVEVNPPGDERETEVVNEATDEVNQLNKALIVVVKETLNEVVIEEAKRKKDSSEQSSRSQYNAKRRYGQITCQTCKRVGHNSRICPERPTGAAAEEEDIDEDEAREQEANWEETMEAAHAAHVADEEDLTQNHLESQPDENTVHHVSTTTTVAPPNTATTPATTSEPAPPVPARPIASTPPTRGKPTSVRGNPVLPRGRGRTTRRGTTTSSTTLPTSTQNTAAAPPPPAQPRVVRHAVGSKSHIPLSPTSATGPSSGSGSMPQGPLVRPTLQAQSSTTFRPPSVTRKTMAAASPATQSRFTGFMPTPSLKKKKQSRPPLSKQSANDKK
ncbi:hypothetical protein Ahy_B07g086952 [Arachis hypogaea]|uniref:PB1-like domain-containing protein n=1 Tax=Arachis hypogaea TaxID=3818 RepID=A0A444YAW8_ARAHY|nr:hypothetical protein Ahy_B07g086952 [Arachis hypogaea]